MTEVYILKNDLGEYWTHEYKWCGTKSAVKAYFNLKNARLAQRYHPRAAIMVAELAGPFKVLEPSEKGTVEDDYK